MLINTKTLEKIADKEKAIEIAQRTHVGGDNDLKQSLLLNLAKKTRFGEDKHQAKKEAMEKHREKCEEQGKPFRIVDVKMPGIYSFSTFENYLKVGGRFLAFMEENNLSARDIKDAVKTHGKAYLKDLEDKGRSNYTVGQAKSFMGKITGKEFDYKLPPQHAEDITKGRQMSERFSLFREDLNQELVTIAKATGGRRSDLEKLEVKNFIREKGIITGVYFEQSKGGRDRFSPILPQYQQEVTKIVNELQRQGKEKVFETVHSKANIHSYRREYARELYSYCQNNDIYRNEILKTYRNYGHDMLPEDKEISTYKTNDGRIFDRECLFITSQGLGHNRLEVVPRNYFK